MSEALEANISVVKPRSQGDLAQRLLEKRGIMRSVELRKAGVTGATVSRMERAGKVIRLSRGIYQLQDAEWDSNHDIAEAAKRVPKGVVCLVSALAFHGLTDQLPQRVWMAIGNKDWAPRNGAGIRIKRFTDALLHADVETVVIEGVPVKVFGVSKTVVDCFRHRRKVGLSIAIEGLRESLSQRKTTPAEIARQAIKGRAWTVIRPYLEALTFNG